MSKTVVLTAADPTPTGSDIFMIGGADPQASDFTIADDSVHDFVIPKAPREHLTIFAYSPTAFSVQMSIAVYGAMRADALTWGAGRFAQLMSAGQGSAEAFMVSIGEGAVGAGGEAGGNPNMSVHEHYAVPALADPWPYIVVEVCGLSAPASGTLELTIVRAWVVRSIGVRCQAST